MGAENTPESSPDLAESAGVLFDLPQKDEKPREVGPVEAGVRSQVDKLTEDGWVTAHHAGQVALAIRTARDVDASEGKGAPSGRANMLRVMKEILELLPSPENAASDALDKALEAMGTTITVPPL